jgi:hypothetical protein
MLMMRSINLLPTRPRWGAKSGWVVGGVSMSSAPPYPLFARITFWHSPVWVLEVAQRLGGSVNGPTVGNFQLLPTFIVLFVSFWLLSHMDLEPL